MPSSARKQRQLQRHQRLEQFRSESPKESLSPTPESAPLSRQQHDQLAPHPYHTTPPPTRFGQQRGASTSSNLSDMTMEEFGGGGHDGSVLEYSDTSDENREDAYFLNQGSFARKMLDEERGSSGESAFREIRTRRNKSARIVRFSSSDNGKPPDFPFEDESFDEGGDQAIPESQPQERPPPDPSSDHPTIKKWMANLAYSFRSPSTGSHRKTAPDHGSKHRHQHSASIMEYPYRSMIPLREHHQISSPSPPPSNAMEGAPLLPVGRHEGVPLLPVGQHNGIAVYGGEYATDKHPLKDKNGTNGAPLNKYPKRARQSPVKSKSVAATISAYFLMDYEAGRPPTLSPNFETITSRQLRVYNFHFSWPWRYFGINLAIIALFMAHTQGVFVTALMHTYAIVIFLVEIWMKEQFYGSDPSRDHSHSERHLMRPLILFLFILGVESWIWYLVVPETGSKVPTLASAAFKPVAFFYVSQKARDALEALIRIGKIVIRVLLIEMFLILTFAAVACQMFHGYDSFRDLSTSWLSLFELSTTVVNPSLWMPMYESSRSNAIFFVFFIVTSVFYLHSLVLSVVFQTYILAATEIHARSASDREGAIRLAFLAMVRDNQSEYIGTASVRKTLQVVRPHYSTMKIKALMEILDPSNQHMIDFPSFRTKIRQALNASIRTARSTSNFAMGVELIAVLVATVNFVYVILLTSNFSAAWFDSISVSGGFAITLLGLLELVIRFNPLKVPNFAPITRLNATFDGMALIGALVSCVGIVQYVAGIETTVDYILMGRAIDMVRIMRFFQIFRDVVRRSGDVLPAMAGPLVLVLTATHVFVYVGMTLWGGAIDIEALSENAQITPLYYLNNFNSYTEGLVTVFNILVVNDWHAIAEVFLFASQCSSPRIVYPFFIATICCGVFIMLNVITAFFVESFVTKLGDMGMAGGRSGEDPVDSARDADFSIRTGENTNVKRISSTRSLKDVSEPADDHKEPFVNGEISQSLTSSSSTEIFSFDVYEREGFDQIMRTVAGASNQEQEAFAQGVCDQLEMFESLTPGREKVGYMVCCQQSMNRFGNCRFQSSARDYVKDDVLHKIVSDMHSELLVLTSRRSFDGRCLVRAFPHKTEPSLQLEINATLLRHQPAVSLLVSRIKPVSHDDP